MIVFFVITFYSNWVFKKCLNLNLNHSASFMQVLFHLPPRSDWALLNKWNEMFQVFSERYLLLPSSSFTISGVTTIVLCLTAEVLRCLLQTTLDTIQPSWKTTACQSQGFFFHAASSSTVARDPLCGWVRLWLGPPGWRSCMAAFLCAICRTGSIYFTSARGMLRI